MGGVFLVIKQMDGDGRWFGLEHGGISDSFKNLSMLKREWNIVLPNKKGVKRDV